MSQQFLTRVLRDKLISNGIKQRKMRDSSEGEKDIDFEPVVKFFNPIGAATWLITEIDPDNQDIMFGLCDLGFQCPELGDVSIKEMSEMSLPMGMKIERDYHWRAKKTLSAYTDEASAAGHISA